VNLNLGLNDNLTLSVENTSAHGAIHATAPATLDGAFGLSLSPGFDPAQGTTLQMLTYPSASGEFASMNVADHELPGNMILAPVYEDTSFSLTAALPGDFDLDGNVGVPDLINWAKNFGTGTTFEQGDSDLSGLVGVPDLIRWAKLFGAAATQGAPPLQAINGAVAIPEPTSLTLIGLGALVLTRRPRKKS
jgi:hypothetical protein